MKQRCSQKLSKEVCGRINCTLHFDGSLTEHILHHKTHMSVVCTLHTQTREIMSGTDLFVRSYRDHVCYQHIITKDSSLQQYSIILIDGVVWHLDVDSDTKPDANGLSCDCSSLVHKKHASTCIFLVGTLS